MAWTASSNHARLCFRAAAASYGHALAALRASLNRALATASFTLAVACGTERHMSRLSGSGVLQTRGEGAPRAGSCGAGQARCRAGVRAPRMGGIARHVGGGRMGMRGPRRGTHKKNSSRSGGGISSGPVLGEAWLYMQREVRQQQAWYMIMTENKRTHGRAWLGRSNGAVQESKGRQRKRKRDRDRAGGRPRRALAAPGSTASTQLPRWYCSCC